MHCDSVNTMWHSWKQMFLPGVLDRAYTASMACIMG